MKRLSIHPFHLLLAALLWLAALGAHAQGKADTRWPPATRSASRCSRTPT